MLRVLKSGSVAVGLVIALGAAPETAQTLGLKQGIPGHSGNLKKSQSEQEVPAGKASCYGRLFQNKATASEPYDERLTAAHRVAAGSWVKVTNLKNASFCHGSH